SPAGARARAADAAAARRCARSRARAAARTRGGRAAAARCAAAARAGAAARPRRGYRAVVATRDRADDQEPEGHDYAARRPARSGHRPDGNLPPMGMGSSEVLLIVVILAIVGYALGVPIVGIARAVKRKGRGVRSTAAVVWSAINVGLFGLLGAYGITTHRPFLGPSIALVLNAVW